MKKGGYFSNQNAKFNSNHKALTEKKGKSLVMPLVWVLLKICGKSSNKKYMPGEIMINMDQFAFFRVKIATDIKRNATSLQ